MAIPLILAPILATLAKKGLNLVGEAVLAKGKDWVEEKTGIELKEGLTREQIIELKVWEGRNKKELEGIAQENLTSRHEADMKSDSWLSKNCRPLCLISVIAATTVGIFIPEEYVSLEKFNALTDLVTFIAGYYFIGRSTEKVGGIGKIFRK